MTPPPDSALIGVRLQHLLAIFGDRELGLVALPLPTTSLHDLRPFEAVVRATGLPFIRMEVVAAELRSRGETTSIRDWALLIPKPSAAVHRTFTAVLSLLIRLSSLTRQSRVLYRLGSLETHVIDVGSMTKVEGHADFGTGMRSYLAERAGRKMALISVDPFLNGKL